MKKKQLCLLLLFFVILILSSETIQAQYVPTVDFFKRSEDPKEVATTLEIILLLTILTLAPAIVLMMTSFTRIIIVLSFIRRAIGIQELPPNQVLISLALILTFMIMTPTFKEIKDYAIVPYMNKEISQKEAMSRAVLPLRKFMFPQTRSKDLILFLEISGIKPTRDMKREDIPTSVLVPAFIVSELRRAFIMGFLIFIPFVIIDLVISSILISMGMLVLPPVLISLPLKVFVFVIVDGWHLVIGSLVSSFKPM